MAFNNLGPPVFIWNSSSVRMRVTYVSSSSPGVDMGAQWIMADPITDANSPWGYLVVKDFAKVREPIYRVSFDPGDPGGYSGSAVSYEVTVRNDAGYAQWFTLQGGGNT
jgi:hypothetical protein